MSIVTMKLQSSPPLPYAIHKTHTFHKVNSSCDFVANIDCRNVSQLELSIVNVDQLTLTVPSSHWLMSTSTTQHVFLSPTAFSQWQLSIFDDDITIYAVLCTALCK